MADIFLSYASEDRDRARQVAEALEAQGWSVFWDRQIPVGKAWHEVLDEQLAAARSMVVLWSQHSIGSKWVREEAREAERLGLPMIPGLLDEVLPPLGFREVQAASLVDWERDHGEFADLCSALPLPEGVRKDDTRHDEVGRIMTDLAYDERGARSPKIQGAKASWASDFVPKRLNRLLALHVTFAGLFSVGLIAARLGAGGAGLAEILLIFAVLVGNMFWISLLVLQTVWLSRSTPGKLSCALTFSAAALFLGFATQADASEAVWVSLLVAAGLAVVAADIWWLSELRKSG